MPRINQVKKSRQQRTCHKCQKVIEIGQPYKWAKPRYGSKKIRCAVCVFKASELTQSEFLSQVYAIDETIAEWTTDTCFESAIEEVVGELEILRDECDDKLNNMPDQLQYAPTGQLLQERQDSCDEMIDELQGVELEVDEEEITTDCKEGFEKEEDESEEDYKTRLQEETQQAIEDKKEEILAELQNICYNGE